MAIKSWGDTSAGNICCIGVSVRDKVLVVHAAGEKLLAEQQDEGLRNMLVLSLTRVMSANGVNQSLDRSNKKLFRENLGAFVVDARSIVRVR